MAPSTWSHTPCPRRRRRPVGGTGSTASDDVVPTVAQQKNGHPAGGEVLGDRGGQRVGPEGELVVDVDHPDLLGARARRCGPPSPRLEWVWAEA